MSTKARTRKAKRRRPPSEAIMFCDRRKKAGIKHTWSKLGRVLINALGKEMIPPKRANATQPRHITIRSYKTEGGPRKLYDPNVEVSQMWIEWHRNALHRKN